MGHVFLNLNRNKRSLVLDLKQAGRRAVLLALVAAGDVLITTCGRRRWRGSASAGSGCARSIRGSSTARRRATVRMGRSPPAGL